MAELQDGLGSPEHYNTNNDLHWEVSEKVLLSINAKFIESSNNRALIVPVSLLEQHSSELCSDSHSLDGIQQLWCIISNTGFSTGTLEHGSENLLHQCPHN
jgi:hypothetical protein